MKNVQNVSISLQLVSVRGNSETAHDLNLDTMKRDVHRWFQIKIENNQLYKVSVVSYPAVYFLFYAINDEYICLKLIL